MSSPSPPDQSAYPSRRPATTSGNGNPTASVVRFSSPVPPAVSPSRHNAPHHVVDVGTSDLGPRSALSYGHAYGVIVNPRSEAMLAPHKRIFRFVRRIVEEIWIDMIFFHLPKMYQTRVREVALHARKNAFIQSCHGRGSGSRVGLQEYSGDVETDLDDETDMDLDEMEVNGSGANLKHPTHQTKPRPGRGIRESHESVNVFTDANNDGMDLAEWNILIGDLLQEWKTVVFAAALMFSATFTLLQLTPSDPITRVGCILSFICAAISLLGGLVCIIRFGGMRMYRKAAVWTGRSLVGNHFIWWNPWIALSVPLVCFIWSIMLLLASAMTFTWRSTVGSSLTSLGAPPSEVVLSHGTILGIRVGISVLLGLGVFLVVLTFVTLGIAESRDSFERPIGASYLPRRRGTRPARQRLDSQTTDDRSEAGTDQAGQHVPSETHQVSNPEEPVAFPALPSTSMIDVSVQTPPVNSPSPQESPPQEIHPYLSPTGSSDAQAQATRSDPSLPIRQEQGRVNRTISASQVTSSPGTSAGRNTSSNNARGSVSVAGNRSAGSGSGSGSGNRSGQARSSQTAQRQSTGRRTSGTDVARPRRQSRTHSTQSHRTSQGRTGNSGRR